MSKKYLTRILMSNYLDAIIHRDEVVEDISALSLQKTKYHGDAYLLRDVQISKSMKLLQIRNGYHNVYLSRTVNVKLFTKRR